jgi:hypothetical protein
MEVGLSQSWQDLLSKIEMILKKPSVIGVIAVDLCEPPKYRMPSPIPTAADYISNEVWDSCVENRQQHDPFGPLVVGNHTWLGRVRCRAYVFFRGEPTESPAVQVRSSYCYWPLGYFLMYIL